MKKGVESATLVDRVVVPRKLTDHEIKRRQAMVAAKVSITDAMIGHELTAMEWVNVFTEAMTRMIWYGLAEEWTDEM